jgi:catechol 2,3-dioxygenase-like lactoylglutathione lyase family enzyme
MSVILPEALTSVDGFPYHEVSTDFDVREEPMSRIQLALNVGDLDSAVDFYSKLFATVPTKRMPGYANFAVAEPPLKLVLIENEKARGAGVSGALNHLGVEVASAEEVKAATMRLSAGGLVPDVQESTTCCYAVQDKAWVIDPDGAPWEVYTVLDDAPDETGLGCSTEGCVPGDAHVTQRAGSSSCC